MSRLHSMALLLSIALSLWSAPALSSTQKDFQGGIKAFQELEFSTSIRLLQTALLSGALSKEKKAKANAYLAVAFYNTGRLGLARKFWKRAILLRKDAALPPGQAPSVQKFFEDIRKKSQKKKIAKARPKKAEKVSAANKKRKQPPLRRAVSVPKKREPPSLVRKRIPKKLSVRTSPLRSVVRTNLPAKRHPISPYVGALGVLTLGAAGGFGLYAQQEAVRMTGNQRESLSVFENARNNASVANALWISGAVILTGAVVLMVVDMRSTKSGTSALKGNKKDRLHALSVLP